VGVPELPAESEKSENVVEAAGVRGRGRTAVQAYHGSQPVRGLSTRRGSPRAGQTLPYAMTGWDAPPPPQPPSDKRKRAANLQIVVHVGHVRSIAERLDECFLRLVDSSLGAQDAAQIPVS
jgi:hypothetical protein